MNKKYFLIGLAVFTFLFWQIIYSPNISDSNADNPELQTDIFEARVIDILEERKIIKDNGQVITQQNILLRGLTKQWQNREITFYGISDLEILDIATYKVGDKVLVQSIPTSDNEEIFMITDYIRRGYLYLLAIIFIAVILIVGKTKGFRALLALLISFVIIIKFLLPQILAGANPLITALLGSLAILMVIIYTTEGWHKKSHLAVISIFFSLLIILILSTLFSALTRLTGLADEEAVFLVGLGKGIIDFKGLLLAGVMIGAAGVLDDIVVGQIEAVQQIKIANPNLTNRQVFQSVYKIGNTHLGAIVNTLFLTYAGASLPLLLLFSLQPSDTITFGMVINNELLATEIVRTLVGSIGVALSMPIATLIGSYYLKNPTNSGSFK